MAVKLTPFAKLLIGAIVLVGSGSVLWNLYKNRKAEGGEPRQAHPAVGRGQPFAEVERRISGDARDDERQRDQSRFAQLLHRMFGQYRHARLQIFECPATRIAASSLTFA